MSNQSGEFGQCTSGWVEFWTDGFTQEQQGRSRSIPRLWSEKGAQITCPHEDKAGMDGGIGGVRRWRMTQAGLGPFG